MKKIIALFTIIASILACAPLQSAIQTAVAETQTVIAQTQVAQVTQIPQLSDINLDSIPCQPGDLLEPYHCGQIIYNRWVEDLPQVAEPDNVIVQRVGWDISDDLNNDFVLIALFKSNDDLQNSFEEVRKVFPTTETSPVVGDRSAEYISADIGPGFLTFIHCSALVVIQFDGATVTEDMVMSYAGTGASTIMNWLQRHKIITVAEGLDMFRVPVPKEFVGKTLAESGIRERTGCTVVGVRSESGMKVAPEPTHLLSESSDLIMIATAEAEDRFLQLWGDRRRDPGN